MKMGKNLFGTFKQPNVVYIGTSTLMSLPGQSTNAGSQRP
ncbi:MAG: hypothetical protein M1156_02190 [Candidatus Marsarchaeota archaeon]|nr:hypothetical protein [Candidatus Marsarchaeota archaeon]